VTIVDQCRPLLSLLGSLRSRSRSNADRTQTEGREVPLLDQSSSARPRSFRPGRSMQQPRRLRRAASDPRRHA